MRQKYRVIFEADLDFETQKHDLDFYLSETVRKMFGIHADSVNIQRILSKEEKKTLQENCIDHQAVDQYCEDCEEGCIGCQKKWLRQLGWGKRELPEKPFPLFGDRLYTVIRPSHKD